VNLASRGARNMDSGEEKIEDPALVEQLQQQAKKVYGESLGFAVIITILVLFLPK